MDDQIGRLRDFLKEKNIDDNTIIFFTSDNGPSGPITRKGIASAGPFRGNKHLMYEGGLRVPSLALWPKHTQVGLVSDYQSSTVDYLPTILDILDISAKKKIPLDGVSFKSVILEGNTAERTVPIAAGYKRLYGGTDIYAYVSGDYKICIPNKGDKMKLFNLKKDPGESHDLAAEKPELLKKMSAELEKVKDSWRLSNEGKDYQW